MAVDFDKVGAGQFVAAAQEYFLRQPDGSLQPTRATPGALQGFLMAMMIQLGEAETAVTAIPVVRLHLGVFMPETKDVIVARARLLDDIKRLKAKFQRMQEIASGYIAEGRFDATGGSLFYCVTSPLLLGWEGDEDCFGPDPKQKSEKAALAGEPVRILRQAEELGDFSASQSVGLMAEYLLESAAKLPEHALEIAKKVEEALEKAAKRVIGQQAIVTTLGLAAVGIAAVLYFTKKKR